MKERKATARVQDRPELAVHGAARVPGQAGVIAGRVVVACQVVLLDRGAIGQHVANREAEVAHVDGQMRGDAGLSQLGSFLAERVRGIDLVARLGGEGFRVLCCGLSDAEAAQAA